MSLLDVGRRFVSAADTFLFPPQCLWCGGSLVMRQRSDLTVRFCTDCVSRLMPARGERCLRCSAPVGPYVQTSDGCVHCRKERLAFDRAFSLGTYDDELRAACLRCKQQHHPALSAGLAELCWEQNRDQLSSQQYDVIIPVPHHWLDRLLRPQQPPETIAERFRRFLMVPVARDILFKVKRTPRQLSLSASARRRNLSFAFKIAGWVRFRGERVLLVDDVMTTGTTAHRVARVLKRAGAESIHVVVISRGLGQ